MTEIGLVACGRGKRAVDVAPARLLYSSPLFRRSAAYVEKRCQRWYILSARHGLVHPDEPLAPYDERLAAPTVAAWNAKIRLQLTGTLAAVEGPVLVVLAGEQYRGFLYPPGRWHFEIPMQGLGIGQQLRWLSEQLGAA